MQITRQRMLFETFLSGILGLPGALVAQQPSAGVASEAPLGTRYAEPDAALFKVPAGYTLQETEPATFNLPVPPPMQP